MSSDEQTLDTLTHSGESTIGLLDRLARSLTVRALALVSGGYLTLVESGRRLTFGDANAHHFSLIF